MPIAFCALRIPVHGPRALPAAAQQKDRNDVRTAIAPRFGLSGARSVDFSGDIQGKPMFETLSFAAAGQFIRCFGRPVAMSTAISICITGVWAVPQLLFARDGAVSMAATQADPMGDVTLSVPDTIDGKIVARHRAAMEADFAASQRSGALMTPAALVMPMSIGWSQRDFVEPMLVAETVVEKAVRSTVAEVAPARRAMAEPLRIASPAVPMTISPFASAEIMARAEAEGAQPEPTLLSKVVYAPVAHAGGLVSSAAGAVGSAGSWTVMQAASLLPRW